MNKFDFITSTQLAASLGIGVDTLRQRIREGLVPGAIRVHARCYRWERAVAEQIVESQKRAERTTP